MYANKEDWSVVFKGFVKISCCCQKNNSALGSVRNLIKMPLLYVVGYFFVFFIVISS